MKDPREKKLPQWAQQLLEDERLKVSLRFPEAPEPKPRFKASQTSGRFIGEQPCDGQRLFYVSGVFIRDGYHEDGLIYSAIGKRGSKRRPSGPYFLSEAGARLSLRWKLSRRFARDLLRAETQTVIRD